MEYLSVAAGTTKARVAPEGGRLASLEVDGLELLVTEGEKPTRWGSFPMIPWCGRLEEAKLTIDGVRHQFPVTSPPHANHGFTHLRSWSVIEAGKQFVRLGCELTSPWPFGGRAEQSFNLNDDSLTISVTVSAGSVPMPVMAGWHPWFRRRLERGGEADLCLEPGAAYQTDERQIPTGQLVTVPAPPWDTCFVDLKGDPVITWPGALELSICSTFDHWVVFTEPEHALCVEPQSGPPNQLNGDPLVLAPGQTFNGSMTLAWQSITA